jgi:CHAT domain-containing protein
LTAGTPDAPIGLEALQAGLAGGDLFIAYLFTDGAGWRFEVSRDSLAVHELPGAAALARLTQAVYEQVNGIHQVPEALLRELGSALLPDIPAGIQRIYVLPDGPLNFIPFDMLPDPAAPRFQPLVERYIVSSLAAAPAGTLFAGSPVEIDRGIAIIANPTLSMEEYRLVSAGWQGRDLPHATLPWAEVEAERLSTLFAPYGVSLLTGADATPAALEHGDVSRRGVLHFATHGFFSSDAGMVAGLALAGADGSDDVLPGLLTPQYARSLPTQAGLVVLNGCETSMGRAFDGEGLQGLSRAFLDNGVQHVIGTLWKVSDRATSQFVYNFYQNLIEQRGTDVALALAKTKREFLKSPRYKNPFFWGGYVHLTLI